MEGFNLHFRDLNEKDLRQKTIIPLFRAMGFQEIVEYHGTNEKGKDIICWKEDELKGRIYYAIVVKKDNIHGSVGKKNSAAEVLFQVRQAFNSPYRDIYGLSEVKIQRCIVITAGTISSSAIESITGDLSATNLDRLLDFIDGDKLETLLQKYLPTNHGRIGSIVYTHDQQRNLYYLYINPKRNPDGGPECVRMEHIQNDANFMINVDYNFDNTVHGIEVLEWRPQGIFGVNEYTPEEILKNESESEE